MPQCWSPEEKDPEPNGTCPDCGEPTFDGESLDYCAWSPVACETCDSRPCDGSC